MAIQPSTTIDILDNIPFTSDYQNTILFATQSSQELFFTTHVKMGYITTYQRTERSMRIQGKADYYYDCNYIRFQNTRYGNKWFYGFITEVNYINDNTTEIVWQMDYIQTYLFDFEFVPCFVEREHSETDFIGEHILDEGISTGEYIGESNTPFGYTDMKIVTGIGVSGDSGVEGSLYDNIFSGLELYAYSDERDVVALINQYSRKADSLVFMYMCPSDLLPTRDGKIPSYFASGSKGHNYPAPSRSDMFGNYIPKNMKLYCYPYNFLHVTNNNGSSLDLRYEFFEGDPNLLVSGTFMPPVTLKLFPVGYKSPGNNHNESLTINNFPYCAWVADYFQNWVGQNAVSSTLGTVTSVIGATAGALTGNPLTIASGVVGIAQSLAMPIQSSFHADTVKGATNSSNVNSAHATNTFYVQRMHITEEYAKVIDNYFSMFGYRTMQLKVPNLNTRPSWNFVKTNNSLVTGKAPSVAKVTLQQAMDRGITFWHGDFVGDYSRDNGAGGTPPEPTTHHLTVESGDGDGDYYLNQYVTITAYDPPTGKYFSHWSYTPSGYVENAFRATTRFIMPNVNATVTANYVSTPPTPKGTLADEMEVDSGAIEWDSTVTAIEDWYYGSTGHREPWCMMAIAYYANRMGSTILEQVSRTASTTACLNYMAGRGKLHYTPQQGGTGSYTPKRGDICFFSWSGDKTNLDHTGIVSKVGSAVIEYISGNTSNPTAGLPDGIFTKAILTNNADLVAYGEMVYSGGAT